MRTFTNLKLVFAFIFLFTFCHDNTVHAQTVFSSVNGSAKSDNFFIDWTIGESLTASLLDADVAVTQGFHQPFFLFPPADNSTNENTDLDLNIFSTPSIVSNLSVFPNPASTFVNVELVPKFDGPCYMAIYNDQGQLVVMYRHYLNTKEKFTKIITLTDWPSGQYYVRVFNENFSEVKRIHIFTNH